MGEGSWVLLVREDARYNPRCPKCYERYKTWGMLFMFFAVSAWAFLYLVAALAG